MNYKEAIMKVIMDLKDPQGTSLIAIKKNVQASLRECQKRYSQGTFLLTLQKMVESGSLVRDEKKCYKLSNSYKKKLSVQDSESFINQQEHSTTATIKAHVKQPDTQSDDEDTPIKTLEDDDDLPFCGVRAMQAQQEYPEEASVNEDEDTIPISYYQRDFPIGSLFCFPIQITTISVDTDPVPVMNPVKIHISKGVKMNLVRATLDEPIANRTLYVCTEENPEFLPLHHFYGESSCSLGLEVCGPTLLYLGVLPLQVDDGGDEDKMNPTDDNEYEHGRVHVFGSVQLLDETTMLHISKARAHILRPNGTRKRESAGSMVKEIKAVDLIVPHDHLQDDTTLTNSMKVQTVETSVSDTAADMDESQQKLSKKQRKLLAKQKAMELEEILAKERGSTSTHDVKTKSESSPKPKPVSLTRERRLDGGVYVRDILLGTGEEVRAGKKVSITYVGSFHDSGKVFDKNQNKKNPLVFRLGTGEVIKGLERGIEGMRVGGERSVTIPPEMGYGKKGMGNVIPGDATLHFEIQLLAIGGK